MDQETPPPITFFKSPLRWLLRKVGVNILTIVAALMIAGSLVIAFKGRDMYHALQNYRATKIAKEAMGYIEAERWEAANHVLQDAIRRMPDEVPLLRAVAELFARGYNDPQSAITFLRRVLSTTSATPADQRRLAEVFLQGGDTNEARRFYAELPPAEQTNRKGLELLSNITRAAGNRTEADKIMRRALMLDPTDKEARLRLAIMDEAEAMDVARTATVKVIWDIARDKDDVALSAIKHLAVSPTLTATQAKDLKTLIEEHPSAPAHDRYIVLHNCLRLNPLDHDAVVNAEVARNQGHSTDSMFEFLRWLGQEGEYQKVLDIVPAEAVARDADVFLIYVDALAAGERWKELLNLMLTRKVPITQTTAHVILAQCYAKLQPDLKEARRQLNAAFAGGRTEIPVLIRAAGLADALHMSDLATHGYKLIAEIRPSLRLQLLEKVLELQRGDRDSSGMMETLHQLHDLRPRNRSYTDQLNYLRLVTGFEMEIAYEELVGFEAPVPADLVESPDVPAPVLRALAALRFGNAEKVKSETESITNKDNLPTGVRAIVSCLLTLTGKDIEGYRLGEKVQAPVLLKEELQFLRRAMSNN